MAMGYRTRRRNKEADILFVDVEHHSKTWGQRITGVLPLSNPMGGITGNVNI